MIVLGCLFDRKDDAEILSLSKCGLSNAANTFQWNVIDGLKEVINEKLSIINVLPVGTYPKKYKKLFLKTRKWQYGDSENVEIGSINLPFLKQKTRAFKTKRLIEKSEDKSILIYSAYEPFLRACHKLDSSYKISLIVTDLPEYYDLQSTSYLRKKLREHNNRNIYKYLKRIDSFVLLTDAMKTPLKVGDRPYTVVEGIVNDVYGEYAGCEKSEKKAVLYTGTLNYKFGIKNLVEAFKKIEGAEYELWICGGGEASEYIKSQSDSRIKFFGYVPKAKIYEMQKAATVLVNPRQNDSEYTKYSFPSKTMEYMLSGTPVVMYKLDGIPDDYDKYLNYVSDNSVEALRDKIVEICNKSVEDRENMGTQARSFVLKEKNAAVQAKRILSVLRG